MSPDDALPPVEPPDAGFIFKLFLVPALIVMLVLAVVFSINWLAHLGSDPTKSLVALQMGRANAWQEANNVAVEMRRNPEFRRDKRLATQIAAILDARLKEPITNDAGVALNEVKLRYFLCKALGEMEIADGLPALLRAAGEERDDNDIDVRCGALEAIGLLTHNLRSNGAEIPSDEILPVVIAASRDRTADDSWRRQLVRSRAAYTLGILGGEEAIARLKFMLGDGYADARYNAAIGLARHGDSACIDVLAEMIDPDVDDGADAEKEKAARPYKRALVQVNGLRAAQRLAEENPQADLASLVEVIDKLLTDEGLPPGVRSKARGAKIVIREQTAGQAAAGR